MNRYAIGALALTVLVGLSGCSIAGTWKSVSVTPEDAIDRFPMDTVTFDDAGMYTATRMSAGMTETTTGEYEWNGMQLKVTPKDDVTRTYPGYKRLDGKLVLSHKEDGEKMTAVFEKVAPEAGVEVETEGAK